MERKTVKFSVTQEDIDSGTQCRTDTCPVALCIARTVGSQAYVAEECSRGGRYIWIDPDNDPDGSWSIPEDVMNFIHAYDEFGAAGVHPFEFELMNVPVR